MPCYAPLSAYQAKKVNSSGKRSLTTDKRLAYDDQVIKLPCGECVGCLKDRAFEWKVRCVHESQLYSANVFVTLTYDDAHLPANASLRKDHFSSFMKRLRFHRGSNIRFFACGEYGPSTKRPHYHALLFNIDFPDKLLSRNARLGHALYESYELHQIWGNGYTSIGAVSPNSIGYVTGYMCKSIQQPIFYSNREPEFRLMSRRPGLGKPWFDRYGHECYRQDNTIINGQKCSVPRYYDTLYAQQDGDHLERVKAARHLKSLTPEAKANATLIRRLMRERRDLLLLTQFQGEL